jgi:hypothetical protein
MPPGGNTSWFHPACPRHTQYDDWRQIGYFLEHLGRVAKNNVDLHPILGLVNLWAEDSYTSARARCFLAACICDDTATEAAVTVRMGGSWGSGEADDIANLADLEGEAELTES